MMAELMGRETGYCKGRGGSMHIAEVERQNNLGSTGIVGGNQPPAVGAALAEKFKNSGKVVLSFFGDGACNTGTFHESMNMAATLKAPLVVFIENNLYGMSVPFSGSEVDGTRCASSIRDIAVRSVAYDVPGMIVDGQDTVAVYLAARKALARARKQGEMTIIECKTYRWYGHSRSDPRAYRTKAEEKAWHERDPITVLRNRLISDGLCTEQELDQIKDKAFAVIEDATQFAVDSPWPNGADVAKDVYVEETYPAQVIANEQKTAAKVREATAAFEKIVATCGAKTKKEASDIAKAQIKSEFGMDIVNIATAVSQAQAEEMRRDKRVFAFGEDIGLYGGAYQATRGLLEEFGKERVIDTAISEAAIAGAAVGAALRGMRPIAEIMYVDFLTISMDQLVHVGAYNRYMFGGKAKVPMVLRTEGGVGRCIAAHHSESLEAWIMHPPGLYVVMPSTPYDAKGLLKAAIRSDNPVIFIENKLLYNSKGAVPEAEYLVPIGAADVKRAGSDLTIVATSRMVLLSLNAAETLAKEGIQAEVIDPRTLKPLDMPTIAASVRKTHRLLVVNEGVRTCGYAAEVMARAYEEVFDYLDAPIVRVTTEDVVIPYSGALEMAAIPNEEKIMQAARAFFN